LEHLDSDLRRPADLGGAYLPALPSAGDARPRPVPGRMSR
jgi:hypothetical protein